MFKIIFKHLSRFNPDDARLVLAYISSLGRYDYILEGLYTEIEGDVIDLIKKLSVSLPMTDFQKVNALKAKTGFDAAAALKHVMEEKEDDGQDTILKTSGERRVKKEEVPAGRRTAPKYNVVTPTEKKEETAE